jgi:hypothetical protein
MMFLVLKILPISRFKLVITRIIKLTIQFSSKIKNCKLPKERKRNKNKKNKNKNKKFKPLPAYNAKPQKLKIKRTINKWLLKMPTSK